MLILTVKPGQQIHIGDDIVVAVMGVSGHQVKVGIEAPREVKVLREELIGTLDLDRNVVEPCCSTAEK